MAIGERAPVALLDFAASARLAVGEALTNIAATQIGDIKRIKLSANWMAAAGHPGEDAGLYEAVKAVGEELCPDLDNFKLINDRFGHNSGDLFLIQVGERLNTLQQNGEVIGRLGGDEFLVVSLNNENADISSLRERIQQQIRGEYHLGDVDLYYPGASLGIVEVDPETTDADSALHAADIAMYQEKKHKQKTPFVTHSALHS